MPAMKKSSDWFSDHSEPPVEETIYSLQHADIFVLSSLDVHVHSSYETLGRHKIITDIREQAY